MRCSSSRWLSCVLVAGLAASCRPSADIQPNDLRTYTVPRSVEKAPRTAIGPPSPPDGRGTMAAPGGLAVEYDLPAGWKDLGASGMRLATLTVGSDAAGDGGEITIIPASGTLQGNAARWQEQLTPGAGPELVSRAIERSEKVSVNGVEGTIILLLDQNPEDQNPENKSPEKQQAILAAMIPLEESVSLFVKFKGSAGLARSLREPFTEFIRSIRWK
jgi:hypothetical protein